MRDLKNAGGEIISVITQTLTADADGATIDLANYRGCTFFAVMGNSGDTLSGTVYIELELEDSPDGSAWTDCIDADVQGSTAGTNTGTWALVNLPAEDSTVFSCRYLGTKQYVRPVVNVTGTHTNGTPIGIMAVREGSTY